MAQRDETVGSGGDPHPEESSAQAQAPLGRGIQRAEFVVVALEEKPRRATT